MPATTRQNKRTPRKIFVTCTQKSTKNYRISQVCNKHRSHFHTNRTVGSGMCDPKRTIISPTTPQPLSRHLLAQQIRSVCQTIKLGTASTPSKSYLAWSVLRRPKATKRSRKIEHQPEHTRIKGRQASIKLLAAYTQKRHSKKKPKKHLTFMKQEACHCQPATTQWRHSRQGHTRTPSWELLRGDQLNMRSFTELFTIALLPRLQIKDFWISFYELYLPQTN